MGDAVLVLNAGSSSLKFQLFGLRGGELELVLKGQVEGLGVHPRLLAKDAAGASLVEETRSVDQVAGHDQALEWLGGWLREPLGEMRLVAVGHRVVHGGTQYDSPVRIDSTVLARLDELVPLAPLHQPHNLSAIRAVQQHEPDLPQVACFDTAFHRGHPQEADRFALPEELYRDGVRRYGFHGLSYEYIAQQLPRTAPDLAEGRVVVAHLGSGASMCALKAGRSVDSTMGFTALDGLPMGTRTGALDPGVLLYLMMERGYDAKRMEKLLYHESGLKGLSGISNDLRDLEASEDPRAELAISYFVYRIVRELGALAAAMGGIDGLVFTAGIGENSPLIRERVCRDVAWLGLDLDEAANRNGKGRISTPTSRLAAWVIPTDEERMIAQHTVDLLQGAGTVPAPSAEQQAEPSPS